MATIGDRVSCTAGVARVSPPATLEKIIPHTPAMAMLKSVADRCMATPVQDLVPAV